MFVERRHMICCRVTFHQKLEVKLNNKQDVFCYRVTFHYKLAFKLNIEQTLKDGMVVQIGKNNKKCFIEREKRENLFVFLQTINNSFNRQGFENHISNLLQYGVF